MKNICILLFINIINLNYTFSQEEILDTSAIDEIVISANKVPEKRSDIAQQVKVLSKKYILSQSPLNAADLLHSTGEVFVQKSQQGGGSPILRGFEASRILIVVDGVRLNNLIYRAGHLQNVITIDPSVMDRVEIIHGAGSTVYGSDALGGVIHFRTRNPVLGSSENVKLFGGVSTGYHTVNQGSNLNMTFNAGWKKFATLSSVTMSRFGDLKMGGAKNPFYDKGYFGERLVYAVRIDNTDVLVTNENKLVQKYSGYDQIDILQKMIFQPSFNSTHILNIQYSNSTNVPRYDRLTDVKGSGLNSAEWYYGPQKRFLSIYNGNFQLDGFFESLDITANFQNVTESRHNRGFGNNNLNHRIEDVSVLGLNISTLHKSEKHELRTGFDTYRNQVVSTAHRENIVTKEIGALDTRYPDGDNSLLNISLYSTHTYKISDHFTLNDGFRVGINNLQSTFKNKQFFPFPFDDVQQNNMVYSGNLGLIYKIKNIRLAYLTTLGFRAPNVDDLSKVFESTPGRIIVPNPNIKPESTFNNEISFTYLNKSWNFESVVYYTRLSNFISTAPSTFNGQTQIEYNNLLSDVYSTTNTNGGYIYGYHVSVRKNINSHMLVYGSLSYTYGQSEQDGKAFPLDHIAPLISKAGIETSYNSLDAAFYIIYNGEKDISDYSPSGEDNAQYAPPTGMPAWMTLNIRGGYKWNKNLKINVGVENILDIQHRYFASGINAPGRNFWCSVKVDF